MTEEAAPPEHRRPAVSLFNETWTFMARADRTPSDEDRGLLLKDLSTIPGIARFW